MTDTTCDAAKEPVTVHPFSFDDERSRRNCSAPPGATQFDEIGEAAGGFGAHARQQVLVRMDRERRVRMAESLGHDLDRDASGDEKAGMGMAQVVEPDMRQTRTRDDPGEQLADRLRVQWLANGVGEHRVARPNAVPVVALAIAPPFEDVFGGGVEFKAASTCTHAPRAADRSRPNTSDASIEVVGEGAQRGPAVAGEDGTVHEGEAGDVQLGEAADGGSRGGTQRP